MAELMKRVGDGKTDFATVKSALARERRECEQLAVERVNVEKAEVEARRSVGGGGGLGKEIEDGCKRCVCTTPKV